MSKKLAAGAGAILLDVKCGRGAFMRTERDARALAETMVTIGRAMDRRTVAIVSAMDQPLGRAVGNALEVAEAIATLRGEGPEDFQELCLTLGGWMLVLGGKARAADEGAADLRRRLRTGDGLFTFSSLVEAQGGDVDAIHDPARLPRARLTAPAPSPLSGTITDIDGAAIGLAVMRLGAGRARKGDTIDPAVGVVLQRTLGTSVVAGEPLAIVHAQTRPAAEAAAADVALAFTIGAGSPPPVGPLIQAVVGADGIWAERAR
jgi:pyrimidine-nucleoside phosphorylase